MTPQKVLHLARRAAPEIGGVESHLAGLKPELSKLGYNTEIITERMLLKKGDVWLSHKLAIWLGMLQQLPRLWRADILHIHDVFWWLLPLLPVLLWKRTFITFHGYESVMGPNWRQKFWHQLAAWCTRGNICIGHFHTTWYGVKTNFISYGAVSGATVHSKAKKIKKAVFLGRLEPDTGFQIYLQAVYLAKKWGKKLTLDVYGEGSEQAWAKQYVRRHGLPVRFFGFVPNVEISLSQYSHAFVSQYLAILESFVAKVPVVAVATTNFKKAYLQDTPFAKSITLVSTPAAVVTACRESFPFSNDASNWAKNQTWQALAKQYSLLWSVR
ncbi:MAG: glycosyltransferase family 4 protein [Candidatus Pacebacteria bacterium]|nr:glycosyltransferase family 4 protein [Candidatus Paceibacterota bacterium]PIR59893.1 MAG: hypothetical protein COU67_04515 [Candidatus Pacebacteria bacterium CG10_big_fil_rev_8_21_14_0_10_44_54]